MAPPPLSRRRNSPSLQLRRREIFQELQVYTLDTYVYILMNISTIQLKLFINYNWNELRSNGGSGGAVPNDADGDEPVRV